MPPKKKAAAKIAAKKQAAAPSKASAAPPPTRPSPTTPEASPSAGVIKQFFADLFTPGKARKFFVACAGLASSLLAANLVPEPYDQYVSAGLATLSALGVYAASNTVTDDSDTGSSAVGFILWLIAVIAVIAGIVQLLQGQLLLGLLLVLIGIAVASGFYLFRGSTG